MICNLKKGKAFGYHHPNKPHVTTKSVSQLDYFMKNGTRVKLLGIAKNSSKLFDIQEVVGMATNMQDDSAPLVLPGVGKLNTLSLLFEVSGMLVQQQKAESDMLLEQSIQMDIDLAKLEGLEAIRKEINTWNHDKKFNWRLLSVTKETANKLVQSEFETMNEVRAFDSDVESFHRDVNILYRNMEDPNQDGRIIQVIEAIFLNH